MLLQYRLNKCDYILVLFVNKAINVMLTICQKYLLRMTMQSICVHKLKNIKVTSERGNTREEIIINHNHKELHLIELK